MACTLKGLVEVGGIEPPLVVWFERPDLRTCYPLQMKAKRRPITEAAFRLSGGVPPTAAIGFTAFNPPDDGLRAPRQLPPEVE